MGKSLQTTIIGGIVFLAPVIFILMILQRAYELALKVAAPISRFIPIESFVGLALANILAAALVIGVCYAAGMVARSSIISARVNKLDEFLSNAIPAYHPTKRGIIDSISDESLEDDWKVVLVGEKGRQRSLGFEVERLSNGDVAVFQPLTPNTKTGFVWTVSPESIEVLEINPRDLTAKLKAYGVGISEQL